MAVRYYVDTCIWIDYMENRSDKFRPLGDWALAFIRKVIESEIELIYSDILLGELSTKYADDKISELFNLIPLKKLVICTKTQFEESRTISRRYRIPLKDTLHSVISRDYSAILVTRDKHFFEIPFKLSIKKPEELI